MEKKQGCWSQELLEQEKQQLCVHYTCVSTASGSPTLRKGKYIRSYKNLYYFVRRGEKTEQIFLPSKWNQNELALVLSLKAKMAFSLDRVTVLTMQSPKRR